MKRFALISDVLFYSVASWFFLLGITRYYRLPTAICLTIATLLSLAIGGGVFLLTYMKRHRVLMNKKQLEEKNALMLHLTLEKPERVRAALLAAYAADGQEAHFDGEAICTENDALIPLFTMQPVSADTVATLLREYGETPFTLVCNALTPEAEALLNTFGRKAVRGDEVYALLHRTDTIPEQMICGEIPRRTVRVKLVRSFSKKNARPFFVSGLLLLIMSLFTFFPTYYLISGSILLFCAIFVRAFGYA